MLEVKYRPTVHDTREVILVNWLSNTKQTLDSLVATVTKSGEGANVSESAAVAGAAAIILSHTADILNDFPRKPAYWRPKHERAIKALEKLVSDTRTNDPRLDLVSCSPALWIKGLGMCLEAVHLNMWETAPQDLRDRSLRTWIDFDQRRHKAFTS